MRAVAILAAIAMLASLFLAWINPALTGGDGLRPWDILKEVQWSMDSLRAFAENSPPEAWVFVGTFALAALFLLLALVGAASRLLALLAGGGAVGLVAYGLMRFSDEARALGMPLPSTDNLVEAAKALPDLLGPGAFAWGGGAIVLLLSGLIGFGARR